MMIMTRGGKWLIRKWEAAFAIIGSLFLSLATARSECQRHGLGRLSHTLGTADLLAAD